MEPGDRPLAPQRLCGCLPLSYGDHTVRSPVSPLGRLDGVPGSPGRLPLGSGTSSFSPVSAVLRAGVGLPVSRPLLWLVDGSSSLHPCHGPGLRDHASSRVPDSPVLGRLAGPRFHLSGGRTGEGLSPLALRPVGDPCQSPQEFLGSQPDHGLSGDDHLDFSFEVFPNPQTGAEVGSPPSGLSLGSLSPCISLASPVGRHVVMSALVPSARLRMRFLQRRLNVSGPLLPEEALVSWDDCCHPDLLWWSNVSHL